MPKPEEPPPGAPPPSQITSEALWQAAELGTGLIELDRSECLELLPAKSVGRLAYVVDHGARILPLNHVVAGDCIILRTVPNGEIFRHALSSICAFEIDETDEFFESG